MDDLLIRGAAVVDGTGGEPRSLDVAVRDGRISAVEETLADCASLREPMSSAIGRPDGEGCTGR
jgi:N-acyl-D-aspartate/D-glutamate deacylase